MDEHVAEQEEDKNDFAQTFYDPFKIKHRRRTSPPQLKILEYHFEQNPKPDVNVRKMLSEQLDMTPREVQVWFQNRRAKTKKMREKAERDIGASKLVDFPRRGSSPAVLSIGADFYGPVFPPYTKSYPEDLEDPAARRYSLPPYTWSKQPEPQPYPPSYTSYPASEMSAPTSASTDWSDDYSRRPSIDGRRSHNEWSPSSSMDEFYQMPYNQQLSQYEFGDSSKHQYPPVEDMRNNPNLVQNQQMNQPSMQPVNKSLPSNLGPPVNPAQATRRQSCPADFIPPPEGMVVASPEASPGAGTQNAPRYPTNLAPGPLPPHRYQPNQQILGPLPTSMSARSNSLGAPMHVPPNLAYNSGPGMMPKRHSFAVSSSGYYSGNNMLPTGVAGPRPDNYYNSAQTPNPPASSPMSSMSAYQYTGPPNFDRRGSTTSMSNQILNTIAEQPVGNGDKHLSIPPNRPFGHRSESFDHGTSDRQTASNVGPIRKTRSHAGLSSAPYPMSNGAHPIPSPYGSALEEAS